MRGTRGFSYSSLNSLARLSIGVEVWLALLASLAGLGAPAANAARHAPVEPEPRPQISDFSPNPDLGEAQRLMKARKWPEAVIALRAVLKQDPSLLPAVYDLARALVYLGRREEALSTLSQRIEHERGARQAFFEKKVMIATLFLTNATFQLYQDGLNLLVAGKYHAAEERFVKALAQEPDNALLLVRMGQSQLLDGDFDSASERLKLARRLDPFEPETKIWLGRAMQQRGELKGAVDELRQAAQEIQASGEVSELSALWLADALYSSSQRGSAIQVLEEDTRKQPLHLSSLLELARLRSEAGGAGGTGSADMQALWAARKDLQSVLSRLSDYESAFALREAGDFKLDLRKLPAAIKEEAQKLLLRIEPRLEDRSGTNES